MGFIIMENLIDSKNTLLRNRVRPGENDLASTEPEIAAEWNYEKNGELIPSQVARASGKKVWWKCEQGHEYQMVVGNRTDQGQGCPYCSGKRVLVGFNDLLTTNPKLAEEWAYEKNNGKTPRDYTRGSQFKAWWKCNRCGYEWQATIHSRNRGTNCPVCCGHIVWIGHNDLATLNPSLAEEWNHEKNGEISPETVTAFSGKRVYWTCKRCGNVWKTSVANRSSGTGCPECLKEYKSSFPEQALFFYIQNLFPDATNRYSDENVTEYDIFIPSKMIAIEYDGAYFHDQPNVIERDKKKDYVSLQKGVTLYRIRGDKRYRKGVPFTVDGNTISYKITDQVALSRVIEYILSLLGVKEEVDVDRDSQQINAGYLKTKKAKSIASVYPELMLDWDYDKNGKLDPETISYGSHKKIHWKCHICGCESESTAKDRARGNGCPQCGETIRKEKYYETKIANSGSFAQKYPEYVQDWDTERNGSITPYDLPYGSNIIVHWKCHSCGYEWEKSPHKFIANGGCPICKKQVEGQIVWSFESHD